MNTAHKWRCYNKNSYPFYVNYDSIQKVRHQKNDVQLDYVFTNDENTIENVVYWNQNNFSQN